jgi:hypothetical protein
MVDSLLSIPGTCENERINGSAVMPSKTPLKASSTCTLDAASGLEQDHEGGLLVTQHVIE